MIRGGLYIYIYSSCSDSIFSQMHFFFLHFYCVFAVVYIYVFKSLYFLIKRWKSGEKGGVERGIAINNYYDDFIGLNE